MAYVKYNTLKEGEEIRITIPWEDSLVFSKTIFRTGNRYTIYLDSIIDSIPNTSSVEFHLHYLGYYEPNNYKYIKDIEVILIALNNLILKTHSDIMLKEYNEIKSSYSVFKSLGIETNPTKRKETFSSEGILAQLTEKATKVLSRKHKRIKLNFKL